MTDYPRTYSAPPPLRPILIFLILSAAVLVLALYNPARIHQDGTRGHIGLSLAIPAHASSIGSAPIDMSRAEAENLTNEVYSDAWQECGNFLPKVLTSERNGSIFLSVTCSHERKG